MEISRSILAGAVVATSGLVGSAFIGGRIYTVVCEIIVPLNDIFNSTINIFNPAIVKDIYDTAKDKNRACLIAAVLVGVKDGFLPGASIGVAIVGTAAISYLAMRALFKRCQA